MRKIGKRVISRPLAAPTAEALRAAAVHQATGRALAAVATTGIAKGIYRFALHADMNRHTDEALVHALMLNAGRRIART